MGLVAHFYERIMPLSGYFVAPSVNTIGYWAIVSAAFAVVMLTFIYYISKKRMGATPANYGLRAGVLPIVASIVTAFIGIALVYVLLFVMQAIFVVDARVWTLGIRTFTLDHFLAMLRYAPFFLIFYFFNTIAVSANTNGVKWGNFLAILLNIGGIVLWLGIHYGILFATGTAWYPTMALNAILLFALAPLLAIAALYARALYARTNNVYLAAFTNTLFITMITLANTAIFWNMG